MKRYGVFGLGRKGTKRNGDTQQRNPKITSTDAPSPSALLFSCGETNHAASTVHYPFSANLAEL
jgi:hypothetical protein